MLAFEVLVNGKTLCIAGAEMSDVMSTSMTWARRDPDRIRFNVGGIVAGKPNEHFLWKTPSIAIGDEIKIRLVDADTWDDPDLVYEPTQNPEALTPPSTT
jgi:hypothetical protein